MTAIGRHGSRSLTRLLIILAGALTLGLGLAAVAGTSVIDPKNFSGEHILFRTDAWAANVAVLMSVLGLMTWLGWRQEQRPAISGRTPLIDRLAVPLAAAVLLVWVGVAGLVWSLSVASVPAADSARVVTAAANAVTGNFSTLQASDSYFRLFPFQLGYVAIAELLLRLFGAQSWQTLAAANVLALVAIYAAILRITHHLFANRRVDLLAILLLAACFQPILFCTFLYGNLIGLAAALWACCLTLSYLRSGRRWLAIPIALLGALSVLVKMNDWIVILAIGIVLLLSALQNRRRFGLVILAITLMLCLAVPQLVVADYERRGGVDLGAGTPQLAWLAMGLQDSTRAPGWYNRYTYDILPANGYVIEKASIQAAADIHKRILQFIRDPRAAASFFARKILSQWNEPSFESIWVSQVKQHVSPVPAFVTSVYAGVANHLLSVWFDLHLQILYLGACLGLLSRLRKATPETALLPLIVLGAFAYHLLFEAKSQYALVYLPLLAPYAAVGWKWLGETVANRLSALGSRRRITVSQTGSGR